MSDNNYIDALQEEFTDEIEDFDPDQLPVIEEEEKATTALNRVIFRDKKIAEIEALRDKKINQATEWANREIKRIDYQKQRLLNNLQYFIEGINRSNPKIKSLNFPGGRIGLRRSFQKIEVDADFIPADHTDDPFVVAKTTYRVAIKDIMANMKDTGELPDYASITPSEQKFYYKPSEVVTDGK